MQAESDLFHILGGMWERALTHRRTAAQFPITTQSLTPQLEHDSWPNQIVRRDLPKCGFRNYDHLALSTLQHPRVDRWDSRRHDCPLPVVWRAISNAVT